MGSCISSLFNYNVILAAPGKGCGGDNLTADPHVASDEDLHFFAYRTFHKNKIKAIK